MSKKPDRSLSDFLGWSLGRLQGHRDRLRIRLGKNIDDEPGLARLSQVIDLLDEMIKIALGGVPTPTEEGQIMLSEATGPSAEALSGPIITPELIKEIEEMPPVSPKPKRQHKPRRLVRFTPYQILALKVIYLDDEPPAKSFVELGRRLNPRLTKISNQCELGKRVVKGLISRLKIIVKDDFNLGSLKEGSRDVVAALFGRYPKKDLDWFEKTALAVMGKPGRPKKNVSV